jgi:hypothetical protein
MILVLELNGDRGAKIVCTVPEDPEIEVEVWSASASRFAGEPDHLSLGHPLAFLGDKGLVRREMTICGHCVIRVSNQHMASSTNRGSLVIGVLFQVLFPILFCPVIRVEVNVISEVGHNSTSGSPNVTTGRVPKVERVRLIRAMATGRVIPVPTSLPSTVVIKWKPIDCHN